jgi:prevent-host-death family protein
MVRIAKSEARKNFSDVVTRAGRRGERVKITHYGKTLAILISPRELEGLDECERQRRASGSGGGSAARAGMGIGKAPVSGQRKAGAGSRNARRR